MGLSPSPVASDSVRVSELSQVAGHPAGVAELLGVGKKNSTHLVSECCECGSRVRVKEKHRRRSIGLLSPYIL